MPIDTLLVAHLDTAKAHDHARVENTRKDVLNEARLLGLRLHDIRHSWASTAAMNGVDGMTVAKLSGHTLAETSEHYTHLSDQSVADAADRVSGRISAALAGSGAEDEGECDNVDG